MSAPGRPQLIVCLSVAVSSLLVRRLAPVGASSRCLSPSAKAPWQSAHPDDFQISRPALILASSWARAVPALAATRTATAVQRTLVSSFDSRSERFISRTPLLAQPITVLVLKALAEVDVRAPIFDAAGARHRALADDLCKQEVGQVLDLPLDQGRGGVGNRQAPRLQICLLQPIAAAVAVGE